MTPDSAAQRDERFIEEFRAALFDPPWWWQASGRTGEEWERDQRRRNLANKCPARIHDDPIFCELPVRLGDDGLGRCADRFIAHVSRPTEDPDRPWVDTGQRERVFA